jgi:hypothetical protein
VSFKASKTTRFTSLDNEVQPSGAASTGKFDFLTLTNRLNTSDGLVICYQIATMKVAGAINRYRIWVDDASLKLFLAKRSSWDSAPLTVFDRHILAEGRAWIKENLVDHASYHRYCPEINVDTSFVFPFHNTLIGSELHYAHWWSHKFRLWDQPREHDTVILDSDSFLTKPAEELYAAASSLRERLGPKWASFVPLISCNFDTAYPGHELALFILCSLIEGDLHSDGNRSFTSGCLNLLPALNTPRDFEAVYRSMATYLTTLQYGLHITQLGMDYGNVPMSLLKKDVGAMSYNHEELYLATRYDHELRKNGIKKGPSANLNCCFLPSDNRNPSDCHVCHNPSFTEWGKMPANNIKRWLRQRI